MSTDVTFLQTLVDERRGELLAEARTARLATLARRWRRSERAPAPPAPPHPPESTPPQRRVPAAAR
ncbi:hypothetical protein [Pseudonocardia sp. WMMC193]|uniref:hypothetical protein n=1 Tax=Pseudonocardia sp. WMMC193 TaxID=2911965 RepID=UPI001F467DDF|nr:hypothetical protein [Pseudonocardia sp. WMMC193]MCF7553064.1 hypothetical protein [Pseudonocardia sp. WMMC193]